MAIDKINQAAGAMRELIDDLLATARLESGSLHLNCKPHDLRDLVRDALRSGLSPEQEQRLRWTGDSSVPASVYVDAPRLRRVVMNLVTNALKFSPHDEPIEVAVERGDGNVILSVRDRGPGMSSAAARDIFDKYRACARSRRQGGLGLGLYTCRLIVEAHGGRCWVQTAPNKGSVFCVSLRSAE